MTLIILIPILMVFALFACNAGSSKKPGHESMGLKPAIYVAIACVVGYAIWPTVGPIVTALFQFFGARF